LIFEIVKGGLSSGAVDGVGGLYPADDEVPVVSSVDVFHSWDISLPDRLWRLVPVRALHFPRT
jgi:hypothetical protein